MESSNKPEGYAYITEPNKKFVSEAQIKRMKGFLENPEPLQKPPYSCPSTRTQELGNGCCFPNCLCEWKL